MKKQYFCARSPLEVGDRVVAEIPDDRRFECEVTDILAVHSARTGIVTFWYVLDWDLVVTLDAIAGRVLEDGRVVRLTPKQTQSTGPAGE